MGTRVCFVAPHVYGYFAPDAGHTGGGAERQVHLLSTTLAEHFDVHVVVGDFGQPRREVRDGVTLHRAYPLQSRQHPLQPVKHFLLLGEAMRRADADLYIYRGGPRNAGFVYLLTRLLRSKWLVHIASDANIKTRPERLSAVRYWLFNRSIIDADLLVAQSERQQNLLEDCYGAEAEVIPNGYPVASDVPPFEAREYFLWVGGLHEEEKRVHRYLDLAELLPETKFRLAGPVATDSDHQAELFERVQSLGNVEMTGAIQPHEIHEQYRHATALVNTSAFEGFPNTFLEAWRQGTPVLGLDVDPKRYLPLQTADGYANGDLQSLAATCRVLATNPEQWQSWANESRSLFEANLSIDSVADRYADVIRNEVQ